MDCPDGTDENNVTCGYPMGFQNGFGVWENSLDTDFEFTLHHGASTTNLAGPTTDAQRDENGRLAQIMEKSFVSYLNY